VQLDQRGHQHVGHRHPAQGQHRQHQEQGLAVRQCPAEQPDDDREQGHERHPVHAGKACGGRREGAKGGEREHR
jgi:hypothetical protein